MSNDSQIFFDACPAPIIGITGSAGKTTTTTLVGEMLLEDERRKTADQVRAPVWVGGNIGNPLIADVENIRPRDRVVLELSSFQLELMTRSPHVACITNITPNHLDRHGTMEAYIAAKHRILDFQSPHDWAVLNADNTVTAHMVSPAKTVWFSVQTEPQRDAAWLDGDGDLRLRIHDQGVDDTVCHVQDLLLIGEHNVMNVLAACAISALGGGSLDAMRTVATTFRGVAHRLQLVGALNGVRYYDDSIATTPERLMAALRCFAHPVVLLCGGRDKHLPWAAAVQLMAQRCKHAVLFGEMAGLVCDEVKRQNVALNVTTCDTLDQAVITASAIGQPGDIVLLSPGGTSFDAFKDFEERGNHFVKIVHAIGDKPSGNGVM